MDLYALITAAVGGWGVIVLMLALKLATCVLTFLVLDRFFSRFPAWLATVLFVVAPCSIMLAHEVANATTLIASLWPLGAFLLTSPRDGTGKPGPVRGPFIGTAVFLAGQTDWFFLTIIPSLFFLLMERTGPWTDRLSATLKKPVCRRFLIGLTVTMVLFGLQVVLYEPDFRGLGTHLAMEAGAAGQKRVSHSGLFSLVALRFVLFVGVPLLLGLIAGLVHWWRRREPLPLVESVLVFLPVYGAAAFILPQYFVRENSMYSSLLFPAAVLTALVLEHHRRFLPWVLACLALPGIVEMHLYASPPLTSATSAAFGQFFAANSEKRDLILTNLDPPEAPFRISDVMASRATRIAADRNIFFGYREAGSWDNDYNVSKLTKAPILFLLDTSRTFSPALKQFLGDHARFLSSATLAVPSEGLNFYDEARSFVFYKIMRKEARPTSTSLGAGVENFEIYRLR
jgi:hypothetical protein